MEYSKSDYKVLSSLIIDLSLFTGITEKAITSELEGLCWDEEQASVIKHYMYEDIYNETP